MDWLPDTAEGVSWGVGLIAVVGGLLGVAFGIASTHWNTSRQLDRHARDARREAYADFIAAAIDCSRYDSDGSVERRAALHLSAQRLRIIGHPDVHVAALDVLDTMLFMLAATDDPADTHARSSWYSVAVDSFTTLARAETRAAGSMSWNRAMAHTADHRHGVDHFLVGEIAGRGMRWAQQQN